MKQVGTRYKALVLVLVLALVVPLLSACGQQVTADTIEQTAASAVYSGALDLSYEGALDATSQLALGTLQLEGTELAVTEAQAGDLLALWQVLRSGQLEGDGETNAVLRQIEAAMSEERVSAIAGLRLTQEDAQAWLEESGSAQAGSTQTDEGQARPGRQRPEGMEDMTDEEREQMRAQMQAQMGTDASAAGAAPRAAGGLSSTALTRAVVQLLTERSGDADAQARAPEPEKQPGSPSSQETDAATDAHDAETESEPAGEPEQAEAVEPDDSETDEPSEPTEPDASGTDALGASVYHVVRAGDSLAGIAAAYGVSVASIVAANEIQDANQIQVGQELVIPEPLQVPEEVNVEPETPSVPVVAAPEPALEELEDTDPGPPLTIEVSANRAAQDPLVDQSRQYLVTGVVRNDGEETYAVSAILATFFDAEGFRGTIDRKIRDGQVVSAEWNWHGQTEAEFAALLLAPGEEWPFRIEITAQDMASFLLHPDAVATERESDPVELSDVQVIDEGMGYLRIRGTATNVNAFEIKNVTVSAVLRDASGEIVSLGSTYVIQEEIAPGESVRFDVRVAKQAFVSYELYAQAEQDW